MLINLRGDDRRVYNEPGLAEELRQNKAEIESDAALYLSGIKAFAPGKDEPSEFRPEVPDNMKGALLRGLVKTHHRPSETKEECLTRHERLKSSFLLDKDAPVRWFNPDTRTYEEL